ncbi:MAG TPA: DinB family protein [Trebonia sp.]
MTGLDVKADLLTYLQGARETLLWKLEGLGEYDLRRPLTPTGTNLLGLVKHSASMELEYFGPVFGRPHGVPLPWLADDAERNADLWAAPGQSRDEIVALYHQAWRHADETIAILPLDAVGRVPWWGENGEVTLNYALVHMTAETQRHAGHADIVRELIDGAAGLLKEHDNLPDVGQEWWRAYYGRVDQAARGAAGN